ncbi:P-type DNA transfer ATPase VirB11 [Xenophilus azovorans]|uniref:P-type DNA transfer ATPase VirB11 n=1 Tax=Xenophilus azovorans TaxID=151755 RepID=UPI001470140C|nr:P-type DNA transfer ATPase VirB11 [Xenophilus azovorans]
MNARVDEEVLTYSEDRRASGMLDHALTQIQALLDSGEWSEVAINRPRELWTEGAKGWQRHDAPDLSFPALMRLGRLIASYNAKPLSEDYPIVGGELPKGERVQVLIPPAVTAQTVSITIRKPSQVNKTLEELEAEGSFEGVREIVTGLLTFETELLQLRQQRRIREFLELAVRSKRTIMVAGKTGSGKTTISKSMLNCIGPEERLVTLEDVHEIFLEQHPNKVHIFYGRADEGARVTARQGLASCLRMKPDRIILSELRADEAWQFINLINTGHPGSISTLHANNAQDTFTRLLMLIKESEAGRTLDVEYIKAILYTTIDIVLFYENRRLVEIYYDPERKRKYME